MKPKRKNILNSQYLKIFIIGFFLLSNSFFSQNNKSKICFISRNSVIVNSIYNIEGKVKDILLLIKKKDSILKNGNDCGDWLEEEHDIAFTNKIAIELNENNYSIRDILFLKNGNNLRIKKGLIIDYRYSIADFEKDFCQKIISNKEIHNENIIYHIPYSLNSSDSFWKFKFKNKRLVEIQFFTPC